MLLIALLGWPVSHSRSPAMHNAAFVAAGIAGLYLPVAVPPERVGEAVAGLRGLGFRGANVTIPHKQTVIPFLDALSPAAQAIGAVNTIVVGEDGALFGDNTDAPGFLADLAAQGVRIEEVRAGGALILGAGGSARAVAYALAAAGAPVTVAARRTEQAEKLVAELAPHLLPSTPAPAAAAMADLWPGIGKWLGQGQSANYLHGDVAYRLVVNCTPMGMVSHVEASPWPEDVAIASQQVFYDLVYNPPDTRFMQQARAAGARSYNGLGMLLHQGALAWEMWTGAPAPLPAMHAALQSPISNL